MFAKVARFIKNRKELTEDKLEALEEIVMDSGKARAILDATKSSMGMQNSLHLVFTIDLLVVSYHTSTHYYLFQMYDFG